MSQGEPVRVYLGARGATINARDRVREILSTADAGDGLVLLDGARLTFISRTAAAELLDAVQRWRAAGRDVEWRYVGTDVAKMLHAVDPNVDVEIVE